MHRNVVFLHGRNHSFIFGADIHRLSNPQAQDRPEDRGARAAVRCIPHPLVHGTLRATRWLLPPRVAPSMHRQEETKEPDLAAADSPI
jgi:hypothetical protein